MDTDIIPFCPCPGRTQAENAEMSPSLLNNTTGWNYDCYEPYSSFSVVIVGLIALPIVCFGFLANLTSIRVFTHRQMRYSPLNWYLTVLSAAGFLTLLTSFFMLVLPRVGEYCGDYLAVRISYVTNPFNIGLGLIAQTTAVYMTVLMSAHRFVGVCFPFKAGNILTRKRCAIAIIVVIAFSFLFNITRFLEVRVSGECWSPGINFTLVELAPSDMRMNSTYITVYLGYAYTIVMFIVPFLLLITMNSKVVYAVHRSRKMHGSMSQSGDDVAKRQELAKEISTSVMLIGIVVVFITCNSLPFIVNIIELLGLNRQEKFAAFFTQAVDICNLLVIVNASINIFVYCVFSEKFRLLAKYYLGCYWMREGELLMTAFDH